MQRGKVTEALDFIRRHAGHQSLSARQVIYLQSTLGSIEAVRTICPRHMPDRAPCWMHKCILNAACIFPQTHACKFVLNVAKCSMHLNIVLVWNCVAAFNKLQKTPDDLVRLNIYKCHLNAIHSYYDYVFNFRFKIYVLPYNGNTKKGENIMLKGLNS